MKKGMLIAATIFVAMPLVAADLGPESVDQAWLKAANANDVEGLVACYAPDAVMYPPDALIVQGKDAIREYYKNFLAAMTLRDAAASDTHYETHGDTAIARGQFTLTLVPKAGGEPIVTKGRFVEVCRKIGNKWVYVIDHASVPMPPPPSK